MIDNARAGKDLFGADPVNPDTYLCVLPLFHSFGQTVIQNGAFAFGGTVVMLPRFEAGPALATDAPGEDHLLRRRPHDVLGPARARSTARSTSRRSRRNLRVAAAGGAALPVEVHKEFEQKFGVTILEGYGLSETSPVASFSPYGEPARPGSIGVPIPGVEMKLIDDEWNEVEDGPDAVGEIAIKGHNIMKGYYNRPDATDEAIRDGWFRSGDLGRRDEDGWYYIVDRSKDMIIRGGYNVYPREIEEVLLQHQAVSLAAVIGVPHESHGEEIKAVVIKNKDFDDVSEQDLVDWGKDRDGVVQVPPHRGVRRRAPDDRHREDPQARALLNRL